MKNKSLKASLILTNVFMVALIAVSVALPWMVTWYVEVRGRSASLATTIMVTCYPCAPIVAVILIQLRGILKNVMNSIILGKENAAHFKVISICCIVIAIITLISGRFYLPFFIVAGTFAFLALLCFILKSIFSDEQEPVEATD